MTALDVLEAAAPYLEAGASGGLIALMVWSILPGRRLFDDREATVQLRRPRWLRRRRRRRRRDDTVELSWWDQADQASQKRAAARLWESGRRSR